jgi:hypothetical protein
MLLKRPGVNQSGKLCGISGLPGPTPPPSVIVIISHIMPGQTQTLDFRP